MQLTNSYAALPERFYQRVRPTPVREPRLLLFNPGLADEIGLDPALAEQPERLAAHLGGNETLPGSEPIATAYAGHQFGGFSPQLGDGRAHLLGELRGRDGVSRELQLKGSGATAFSRGGDGRCAIGPAVREFIMAEAMHALGIRTTRSLAVVTTGESVRRETLLPGAVVTRVARSHMRVGTFQYFAARGDAAALQALANYAIERLYPALRERPEGPERYLGLLEAVIAAQVELVTDWMRVGFVHGVMNTDNTAISGETIDFGPCAMMSAYDPATVFSSIDRGGRYAYGNQPGIIAWNMARLAETFLPLIDEDEKRALERAQACISTVPHLLDDAWQTMMVGKLGLPSADADEDRALLAGLLKQMHEGKLDYTITFDRLTESLAEGSDELLDGLEAGWVVRWHQRLASHGVSDEAAREAMRARNPVVIPRNHHVEAMLTITAETRDPSYVEGFLDVLRTPYERRPETEKFTDAPADGDKNYVTFCGT